MTRIKYLMQAPAGCGEMAMGDGTYYWPEMREIDGRDVLVIETTNASHLKVLRQHGFSDLAIEEIAPPPTSYGLMNYDEMGGSELRAALTERGVAFDPEGGRQALEFAAKSWNDARKGRVKVVDHDATADTAINDALFGAPDEPKVKIDVGAMTGKELKALLTEHGIVFNPAAPKPALMRIAQNAGIAKAA